MLIVWYSLRNKSNAKRPDSIFIILQHHCLFHIRLVNVEKARLLGNNINGNLLLVWKSIRCELKA